MSMGDVNAVPVLTYLFHRIEQRLTGRPTLDRDRGGLAHADPRLFAAKLEEWLRVLRKANAAVVFVTQSLAEVYRSPRRDLLLESCPTRLFLPNPGARSEQTGELYRRIGLSRREIEIVAGAMPKRHYYYASPLGRRLIDLGLGPVALSFVGASEREDLQHARALIASHGSDWPAEWLRSRGLAGCGRGVAGPTRRNAHANSSRTPAAGAVGSDRVLVAVSSRAARGSRASTLVIDAPNLVQNIITAVQQTLSVAAGGADGGATRAPRSRSRSQQLAARARRCCRTWRCTPARPGPWPGARRRRGTRAPRRRRSSRALDPLHARERRERVREPLPRLRRRRRDWAAAYDSWSTSALDTLRGTLASAGRNVADAPSVQAASTRCDGRTTAPRAGSKPFRWATRSRASRSQR